MTVPTQFSSKGGNILVLTYWSFSDALIQTYTLPYVRMMGNVIAHPRKIFLVTLEKDRKSTRERRQRLPDEDKIIWMPLAYHAFGWKAFAFWMMQLMRLIWLTWTEGISFIHCWGTPPGAIGCVLSWLTGRTLVLDSYEPHAESMVENGTWSSQGIPFRLLFWMEKKQTQRASFFIAATEAMRSYAEEKYGVSPENFFTKPAGVNLDRFNLTQVKKPEIMSRLGLRPEHIVCVYAGKFGGIYLTQEVFDFFSVAAAYWKKAFRVVLLTNASVDEIERYCVLSGLDRDIVTVEFIPHRDIAPYLGVGDFSITPVKPVPSKRYCTPIKDGEYWALGLPVVIPANISDDSLIIERHDIGAVLDELNETAYREAVIKINRLIKDPSMRDTIRKVACQYRSFGQAEEIYRQIYGFYA
jgi:hypothetical protein